MREIKFHSICLAFGALIALCAVTFSGLFQPGPAFTAMNTAILLWAAYLVHLLDSAVLSAKARAEQSSVGPVETHTTAA